MITEQQLTLALFYCQNVPKSGEEDRQALEEEFGKSIRLFQFRAAEGWTRFIY